MSWTGEVENMLNSVGLALSSTSTSDNEPKDVPTDVTAGLTIPSTSDAPRKPTIVIVPGLWEGVQPFARVEELLRSAGFPVVMAPLQSTGISSSSNGYTMNGDIDGIKQVITPLVQTDLNRVILIAHSAGGFLGSEAIKNLTVPARKAYGLAGGVAGIIFLTAGVMEEGRKHEPLPFMDITPPPPEWDFRDQGMFCKDPRSTLFNDFSDEEADKLRKELRCHPPRGWFGVTAFCGWKEVPSIYLVCERDAILSPRLQEQMAKLAGSRTERCESGHMVMVKMPERVVEVVEQAVEEFVD